MKECEVREKEECSWCNSTGDIHKNRKIYWGAIAIIVLVLVIIYLFAINV